MSDPTQVNGVGNTNSANENPNTPPTGGGQPAQGDPHPTVLTGKPAKIDGADAGKEALEPVFSVENWVSAFRVVSDYYGLHTSSQAATLSGRWDADFSTSARLQNLARQLGLRIRFEDVANFNLNDALWRLPLIVELTGGQIFVVRSLDGQGGAQGVLVGDGGMETTLPIETITQSLSQVIASRPLRSAPDARVDMYIEPYDEHWLRKIVLRNYRPYGYVFLASFISNVLGLAGILFSMQVYDRFVPTGSYPTLYILFAGVLLAIALDYSLRKARTAIVDKLGKRADIRLSDAVFGHALRVRNRYRPKSTGSYISQIRELDHVREMLTSTTVSTIADLPFILVSLGVFWYLGGIMVLVPIGALILMIGPPILAQRRLHALTRESMRESSLRSALLVESIQGGEDIKMLQGEERFQRKWNHYNAVVGEAQLRQRDLTSSLTTWSAKVQGGVYAATVFFGAPMIIAGDFTTGTLVGMSMLSSRVMGPVTRISGLLVRFQQARIAVKGLNALMKLPVDHPDGESRVHRAALRGDYQLKDTVFRYGDDTTPVAFHSKALTVKSGEHIALLGRNGSGKSTLLQAFAGLLEPSEGELVLDDVALSHIDPADVRRDIGMLTQNSRLFHGTIKENILMGAPQATDQDVLQSLMMVGADSFIRRLPKGLEHVILEDGHGLSGGQKQALLLARTIIRNPSIVLLDEPTAAMDEATERNFVAQFKAWSEGRTVIVATHRTRVLDLVDRIMIIDAGTVLRDGPRDTIMKGGSTRKVVRPSPLQPPVQTSVPAPASAPVTAANTGVQL